MPSPNRGRPRSPPRPRRGTARSAKPADPSAGPAGIQWPCTRPCARSTPVRMRNLRDPRGAGRTSLTDGAEADPNVRVVALPESTSRSRPGTDNLGPQYPAQVTANGRSTSSASARRRAGPPSPTLRRRRLAKLAVCDHDGIGSPSVAGGASTPGLRAPAALGQGHRRGPRHLPVPQPSTRGETEAGCARTGAIEEAAGSARWTSGRVGPTESSTRSTRRCSSTVRRRRAHYGRWALGVRPLRRTASQAQRPGLEEDDLSAARGESRAALLPAGPAPTTATRGRVMPRPWSCDQRRSSRRSRPPPRRPGRRGRI